MDELMQQGVQLMVLGMGAVFLFLGLLVGIISLVSRLIQSFELKQAEATAAESSAHDDLLEVMSAAVKQYRADHPRKR